MKKLFFAVLSALLGLIFAPARLCAQDVTVGDPVWFLPGDKPDKLPKLKEPLQVAFPDEMRGTAEISYGIIIWGFHTNGLLSKAEATDVRCQRAVEDKLSDLQVSGAKRNGRTVDTRVWIPVIFNPRSAAASESTSIPRLLAIAPVVILERPKNPIVRMRLSLDATGAIVAAKPETDVEEQSLNAIKESLKAWRFAPARKDGQPVSAELVVPVLCQLLLQPDASNGSFVRVLSRVAPIYPYAMRRSGTRGEVTMFFEVDTNGRAQNVVVKRSSDPAFNKPALKALSKWRFKPSMRDGKPVKTKVEQTIEFNSGGN